MTKVYTVQDLKDATRKAGRPVTDSYIRRLCRDHRIPGATKIAGSWVVPESMALRWLQDWAEGK